MLPFFMASIPPDLESAAVFREATKDLSLKEIAAACDVRESLVCKWRQVGNVPDRHVDKLPEDARRRYAELQAKRRGAIVLERDMVRSGVEFVLSLVPFAMLKATLAPPERGALSSGGRSRSVA